MHLTEINTIFDNAELVKQTRRFKTEKATYNFNPVYERVYKCNLYYDFLIVLKF